MTDTPKTPKDPKPAEGTGVCLTPEKPAKADPTTAKESGSVSQSASDAK
jgi:hypothetical protein